MKTAALRRGPLAVLAALVSGACWLPAAAAQAEAVLDVTQRPFEELLGTEIVTAAKLARQVSDAASAVSIVTAQDIRAYGYRTLDDILGSMRGLYLSHDFRYSYLGGRGYGDPGDYAGRITLLIDGYAAPEGYFGQSFFGEDGFLDVELIERVEYIPGAGSSSYGGGAFLGVVNIITKKGADFGSTQVAFDFGSHHLQKQRITWGRALEGGGDLLLSASRYRSEGYIFPTDPNSDATGRAGQQSNQRLFVKGSFNGWTLTSAAVQRPIDIPSSPGQRATDTSGFTSLKHDADLSPQLKLSTHAYLGRYLYSANLDDAGGMETSASRWWGVDTKLVSTRLDRHTLVIGGEFRNDAQQSYQSSSAVNGDYSNSVQRKTLSLYAYDDITLSSQTQLNLGLRHERRDNHTGFTSPRGALIWTPQPGRSFKLSTGVAYLQPTPDAESYLPDASIERLRTTELVWEQRLAAATRLTSSIYRYRIDRRPFAIPLTVRGAELELEHQWAEGSRLRTSYAWQDTRREDGTWRINSPHHNAKFNFTTPLLGERLRIGTELQVLGPRLRYDGKELPSAVVANLTLTSQGWWPNWRASLSVRNAFNRRYADVKYPGNDLQTFPRDGRNIWLQISRDFK
ncbi:TonB-dependent receptor [Xylophilus sp. GW821-FHT01B05]